MEEYRDLSLTAEAFRRTLERPGLENVAAGIVRQAYIPDSARYQREITAWARQRVAAGGAPITLRIVKGANMEMERFEAAQRGWPQAPYKTKLETDANYKRMVNEAMKPDNIAAVRLGVASHNLFDISYALVQAAEKELLDKVQFEMLEGMANAQRRALFELTRNVLLYAPVCRKQDFIHAIGYLVRRLDENTGPENFLRHAFHIRPDQSRLATACAGLYRGARGVRNRFGRAAKDAKSPFAALARECCRQWLATYGQRAGHRFFLAAQRRLGEADHRRLGAAMR